MTETIVTQDIHDGRLHGYLARPEVPARGGVLILPTIFAVNVFARGYADTLARAGLTAAVWDPYSGLPLVTDYQESIQRARKLNDDGVAALAGQWLDHLAGDRGLAAVGVLGFCLGGRYALLLAAQDERIKACAATYPSIEQPVLANQQHDALVLASSIRCPVHLVEPGHDHVTSADTYAKLRDALHRRSAATIVQFHPDAEHGFMHRPEPPANPAATAIASPQMIAFLRACLA